MGDQDHRPVAAQAVEQVAAGHHAHALGREDRAVEPLPDPRRRQQRLEALLFDEQRRLVAVLRLGVVVDATTADVDAQARGRSISWPQIVTHRHGAERHAGAGVRLDQVPAGVVDHVPIGALLLVLGDVVGQQGLREILVLDGCPPISSAISGRAAYMICRALAGSRAHRYRWPSGRPLPSPPTPLP